MLTHLGFSNGISLIEDTFGPRVTEGGRLGRIKNIFDERIDNAGFIEVCNLLCNTLRYPPLPVDFSKALDDWRKNYFYQHGRNFGATESSPSLPEVQCNWCFDSGIVKIKHIEPDSFAKLLRCDCTSGVKDGSVLPIWSNELRSGFVKVEIDPKWFNPGITPVDDDVMMNQKVWNKVQEWKKLIKKSEIYWRDLGYGNKQWDQRP